MKKFLDILMLVLLILLVINLFSDKPELKPDNSLTFEFSDNSYNIPASVILNIKNNTSTGLVLNTCDDININYL
jgi:hypothetical protein